MDTRRIISLVYTSNKIYRREHLVSVFDAASTRSFSIN